MWCVEIQMETSIVFTMSASTMPLSLHLALAKRLALNAPIMCVLYLNIYFFNLLMPLEIDRFFLLIFYMHVSMCSSNC